MFFTTSDDFRKWLTKNHAKHSELLVGFYKRDSGKPSLTWPESVDQALCFGWIDGVRKRIDEESYSIRFTPRRQGSTWSAVNIERVRVLSELGLMQPSGLAAFEARTEANSSVYSYEQRTAVLEEPYQSMFKKERAACKFFEMQAASYRKAVCWWIMTAKKEETRLRRLDLLIECSKAGERLLQFMPRR
jgi:uncharacterized protein YdeI (YjbR/CyaY-like superfamily)